MKENNVFLNNENNPLVSNQEKKALNIHEVRLLNYIREHLNKPVAISNMEVFDIELLMPTSFFPYILTLMDKHYPQMNIGEHFVFSQDFYSVFLHVAQPYENSFVSNPEFMKCFVEVIKKYECDEFYDLSPDTNDMDLIFKNFKVLINK